MHPFNCLLIINAHKIVHLMLLLHCLNMMLCVFSLYSMFNGTLDAYSYFKNWKFEANERKKLATTTTKIKFLTNGIFGCLNFSSTLLSLSEFIACHEILSVNMSEWNMLPPFQMYNNHIEIKFNRQVWYSWEFDVRKSSITLI